MSEKNQPWTLNYANTTAHHARLSSNFDSFILFRYTFVTIFLKLARCGYTLRVTSQASYSPEYITQTQKKLLLDYVDIEGTRFGSEISHTRTDPDRVAQLAEHWVSIPKVVGSILTVARHIFQACHAGVDIHSE